MKKTALMMVIALALAIVVNAQTRVEVKTADLPKAISEKVTADYAGFAIQNVTKVTKDNQTTYELVVSKGSEKEKLCYDTTGKFIKKAPIAKANAQKSGNKAKQVAKADNKKAPVQKTQSANVPAQKTEQKVK